MSLRLQTEPASVSVPVSVAPVAGSMAAAAALRPRLDGIDFLRGLVMAFMVLDHTRDFFSGSGANPRDVHDTALFLTRWITHYCAPIFIFLAGISAFLYGNRGRTTGEVARFLFTRGLWLIFIELTLVRLGWTFDLSYDFVLLQVIWAIGCSMLVLAALVFLPRRVIAAFCLAVILGHNLLDGIAPGDLGAFHWLWMLMHAPGTLQPLPGMELMVLYPLVPWVAVMAAGYLVGPVFLREESQRRRTLLTLGVAVTVGFVVLRATNLYGDPAAWSAEASVVATVLSFLNCEKYPPSLLYLAMTIGPGLIVLASFSGARSMLARMVITIGRVPFLFYVAHIFLLHAAAVVWAALATGEVAWLFRGMPAMAKPDGFGVSLPTIYVLWIGALAALYPLCHRFGQIKQSRKDWWLSYL